MLEILDLHINVLKKMNKYENFSKEELLKLVEKQEEELKSKKYGLVWDSKVN